MARNEQEYQYQTMIQKLDQMNAKATHMLDVLEKMHESTKQMLKEELQSLKDNQEDRNLHKMIDDTLDLLVKDTREVENLELPKCDVKKKVSYKMDEMRQRVMQLKAVFMLLNLENSSPPS